MRNLIRSVMILVLGLALVLTIALWLNPGWDRPSSTAPRNSKLASTPSTTPQDLKRKAECQQMLTKLNRGRFPIYNSTERNGDVLRVYVMPAFYLATIQQKEMLPPVLVCSEDPGISVIRFLDAHTGKRVALWGEAVGFSMSE